MKKARPTPKSRPRLARGDAVESCCHAHVVVCVPPTYLIIIHRTALAATNHRFLNIRGEAVAPKGQLVTIAAVNRLGRAALT